jgi:hypothetical protein
VTRGARRKRRVKERHDGSLPPPRAGRRAALLLAAAAAALLVSRPHAAAAKDAAPTPRAATVVCGQAITVSTLVSNDLTDCPGVGLVVNAPGIVLNLGGHTIDGNGGQAGISFAAAADGAAVMNGTVQGFSTG